MRAEIAELRAEVAVLRSELLTEMHQLFVAQTRWLVGTMVPMSGLLFALLRLTGA